MNRPRDTSIAADQLSFRRVSVHIEVPFHDVDSLKVVWHGHYYKYFEVARTAYLRKIGFDVPEMKAAGYVWPVIESQCRYVAPLRYGMVAEVAAWLVDVEHRVKFAYQITDSRTNQRIATGFTVQAAVHVGTGELILNTPRAFLDVLQRRP